MKVDMSRIFNLIVLLFTYCYSKYIYTGLPNIYFLFSSLLVHFNVIISSSLCLLLPESPAAVNSPGDAGDPVSYLH